MTSETSKTPDKTSLPGTPAVAPPVVWWLRLEGLAAAAFSAVVYAHLHSQNKASWWLFAALWLLPDLSFLGYLAGPRIGAHAYNSVHSYLLPSALAMAAVALPYPGLLPFALIWFNHIGVDRLLGYGLKYPAGFGFTHLKRPLKHLGK